MTCLDCSYKIKTPWSRVQPHSQGSSLRRKRKKEEGEEEEEVVIEDLVGGMAPGLGGGGCLVWY